MKSLFKRFDIRISVFYAIIASLWIILSDTLVAKYFAHRDFTIALIDIFKGLAFVAATTLALFALLSTELRKRNEAEREAARSIELELAKRRVEAILNNSLDGILLVAGDLHIQQTNAAFNTILCCDADDYFETSLLDLIHLGDRERVAAAVQAVLTEQAGKHIEARVTRQDGTTFHAELSIGFIHALESIKDGLVARFATSPSVKRARLNCAIMPAFRKTSAML